MKKHKPFIFSIYNGLTDEEKAVLEWVKFMAQYEIPTTPKEVRKRMPQLKMQTVVRRLNDLKLKGFLSVHRRNKTVFYTPTQRNAEVYKREDGVTVYPTKYCSGYGYDNPEYGDIQL